MQTLALASIRSRLAFECVTPTVQRSVSPYHASGASEVGELRLHLTARQRQRSRDDVVGVGEGGRARESKRDRDNSRTHGATVACVLATVLGAGCLETLDEMDNIFYDGDGRKVHCAVNLDDEANQTFDSIDTGLDRAVERNEVIELYAHRPGVTVAMATLEHTIAGAQARGLRFVLYSEFARGEGTGPGIALSLDDSSVDLWEDAMPLFRQYGAKVTFFVTRWARFSDERKAQLASFAAEGHELQAHGVAHLRAPPYVEEHGLEAYMREEAVPSIEAMRADGYPVEVFAYPFGARTHEIDEALLEHVSILRSISFSWSWPVQDACP
jgi:Polysaccharide deacetylase